MSVLWHLVCSVKLQVSAAACLPLNATLHPLKNNPSRLLRNAFGRLPPFRACFATKVAHCSPHGIPSCLNGGATQLGELLITATLRHEMPELEAEHGSLIKQRAKNAAEIMSLEEAMLTAINTTSTEALLHESDVYNMLVALQVRARACACP